jgi:hypothetical protein
MSKLVQEVNAEFRAVLERMDTPANPAANILKEVNQSFIDRRCTITGKSGEMPIPTFIKPVFIDKDRVAEIKYANETLMGVLEKLCALYYSDKSTRPMFELTDSEAMLSEVPRRTKRLVWITRNDAFMGDDYLKLIEFNTDSPGGPMYSDTQAELLENIPPIVELRKKYNMEFYRFVPQIEKILLSAYREWGGKKEKPNICIVGGRKSATYPEFCLIVEWLNRKGYKSVFADPTECEYDGKKLTAFGTEIDVAYRRGWIRDWTDHMDEIRPLISAFRDGAVCVVNTPSTVMASNKSLMAVMQRPDIQKMFTPDERKAIAQYVPWTRIMRPGKTTDYEGKDADLYDFVGKHRETLVLKPLDMFGGKDVCVGPFADDKTWGEWMQKTTKARFIVQQYARIPEEDMPMLSPKLDWRPKKVNVNFYCYDCQYAGGMVRTSDSPVINVSAGGGQTSIMIVSRKA